MPAQHGGIDGAKKPLEISNTQRWALLSSLFLLCFLKNSPADFVEFHGLK